MDLVLNTVLKSIDVECVLNIDGLEQSYRNGPAAMEHFSPSAIYSIQKIGVKDGKVYVEACNQTETIAQHNTAWMETEKTRSGAEPSFF